MGTQSFPAQRHSGPRWWALCPAQTRELPFTGAQEAWFCGNAQKGCIPSASLWFRAALVPVTVATGWGLSCPAGMILGSSRLAVVGVPILEGHPAQPHRSGPGGDKRVTSSSASHAWRPAPLEGLTPALQVPMGPAGFFHRVIKCQSPRGRQRQLPRLQIRGAREAGCAQGQEAARPCTCSPSPAPAGMTLSPLNHIVFGEG